MILGRKPDQWREAKRQAKFVIIARHTHLTNTVNTVIEAGMTQGLGTLYDTPCFRMRDI